MISEYWLPADPKAVPAARHTIMAACLEVGMSEEGCFALDLALGEALANAVVHGSPSPTAYLRSVCVHLWVYQGRLFVQVRDHGAGFEPPMPPYPMPAADSGATHGRGLPLMQGLTDALAVCREDARDPGASIYLIKNIA